MKFGICLPNFGHTSSKEAITTIAKKAESAGYDSLWTTDHLLMPTEQKEPYGRLFEAVTTLAYVAPFTEKINLGTSVIIIPMRDPVLLAKQLAAIDAFSDGRLILGVGVGWNHAEYKYLRADFHRRGRIADEWIRAMKNLWSEDEPKFEGRWVKFSDVAFEPKPVQKGGPPIWVGGKSDAAIRRAVTLGDAWHPVGLPPEELKKGVEKLREYGGERTALTARLRAKIDPASEPWYDRLGQKVFALAGSEKKIASLLEEYAVLKLEHLALFFEEETTSKAVQQMETFAKNIIPSFR